jgi:hypothetical protein
LTFLGTQAIAQYGWGLFVGLPFCLGLFAVLTHSYHQQRSYGECVTVAVLPVAMLGAVLMLVAIEGVICIMMAAPLAFCLALLGGSLGYGIQAAHWGRRHTPAMLGMVLLFTPGFYGIEHFTRPQPGVFEVKSAIEINAPPEKVWQKVIAFTEIPPPKETLFRFGVAYPIRAEIAGHGPGAVRHCVFSTGPFVEPITVWDEPHLLRFSVTENPAPMNELTPYGHIEPKHLHGYFESHQGQFLLTELPGGRTRVESKAPRGIPTLCGPKPTGTGGPTTSFVASTCASSITSAWKWEDLQVYDQRGNQLRQARDWFAKNYIVNNIDDAMRIAPMGSESGTTWDGNRYWEQACALLNYGYARGPFL